MTKREKIRSQVPLPVARRLPQYLSLGGELDRAGVEWISSQELADALGLTSSTVRQDLSYLALSGKSRRGYPVPGLLAALRTKLGIDKTQRVLIVGAGNLGCALACYEDFAQRGFNVCALLDRDPELVGRRVGHLAVQPMTALETLSKVWTLDIGILAVPMDEAQAVADQLVAAGVRSLLNLACGRIHAPAHIPVVGASYIEHLQELAHALQEQESQTREALEAERLFSSRTG